MNSSWAALIISIIKEVEPEEAFFLFEHGHGSRDSVTMNLRMTKLDSQMGRDEIAERYGKTRAAVDNRIKRHKRKQRNANIFAQN